MTPENGYISREHSDSLCFCNAAKDITSVLYSEREQRVFNNHILPRIIHLAGDNVAKMADYMHEIREYLARGYSIFNVKFIVNHPVKALQDMQSRKVPILCARNKKISYDTVNESIDDYSNLVYENTVEGTISKVERIAAETI